MTQQIESHIRTKFKIDKKIGSGAYGIVWKVIDRADQKVKALKKNFDAFNNSTDAQRTYREVMFLMELSHPNIIKMEQVIRAENDSDIYLVFEHMDIDLYTLIREGILSEKHKKYILYQMAKAMYYLHSAGLIHRDLKPSNILVNENCEAKLCDFGLVRSLDDQSKIQTDILTEYIATRWYRAPEILLGSTQYSKSIDIWSFGCLLGELQRGKPLFAGTSTMNQIERVLAWTGKPSESEINSLKLNSGAELLDNLSKMKKINKKDMLPKISKNCLSLLNKCLEFDPAKRPTIEDILKHPYLSEYYDPKDILKSETKIKIPINDNKRLSLREYRQLIYREIAKKSDTTTCDNILYRIRQKLQKPIRSSNSRTHNHNVAEQMAHHNFTKKESSSQKETSHKESSQKESSQKEISQKEISQKEPESRTVSIKEQESKKKSFYRRQAKHTKTLESDWEPMQAKNASLVKNQDLRQTKTRWNHRKKSTSEAGQRPNRYLSSHLSSYHKKL